MGSGCPLLAHDPEDLEPGTVQPRPLVQEPADRLLEELIPPGQAVGDVSHARRHQQGTEDAREVARSVQQEPRHQQLDAEQDQGEQEARVEGVERRQRHGLALLLAQALRALDAGEQPKGVEQVEQHGGEHGRVDQPQRRRQQREHVADRPEQQVEGDRDGDVGDHDRQPAHQAAPKQPPRAQDAVRRGLRIAGHNQGLQHHRRERHPLGEPLGH